MVHRAHRLVDCRDRSTGQHPLSPTGQRSSDCRFWRDLQWRSDGRDELWPASRSRLLEAKLRGLHDQQVAAEFVHDLLRGVADKQPLQSGPRHRSPSFARNTAANCAALLTIGSDRAENFPTGTRMILIGRMLSDVSATNKIRLPASFLADALRATRVILRCENSPV